MLSEVLSSWLLLVRGLGGALCFSCSLGEVPGLLLAQALASLLPDNEAFEKNRVL